MAEVQHTGGPKLRFAVIGAGFWAQFQLAGWLELDGVECAAVVDKVPEKAQALAGRFGVPAIYTDAAGLFASQQLDFVDVITDVDSHAHLVELAAQQRVPVICQKPMAPDLATARRLVEVCRSAGVPFMIHENWRWQRPIRELSRVLRSGVVGRPFRASILYANSFPVFANQPFLRELEQFILIDIGSHILDVARFLFGDARTLYCHTARIAPDIAGEDVATVMLQTVDDVTVTCALSYASRVEHDRFPETYIFVEGTEGAVELGPDYWLRTTTADGTLARRCVPPRYPWADPAYDIVHASIVDCNAELLQALRSGEPAETAAEDNIRTVELYYGAYESAATGQAVSPHASLTK